LHYFNVATNLMQRFMIGYESEPDNFYLKGETVRNAPIISCRVYGPKGQFTYGLHKNNLTSNTPSRYRFMLTKEGWHRVIDDEGNELLRIETTNQEGNRITRIYGEVLDNQGKLAARGDEHGLFVHCPARLG
jgi:hypothetical protein